MNLVKQIADAFKRVTRRNKIGSTYNYAGVTIAGDREIVLAAIQQNPKAVTDAAEALRLEREALFPFLKQNGDHAAIQRAVVKELKNILDGKSPNPELWTNREFVHVAVVTDGLALRYASDELKNDYEIVRSAVTKNGLALRYASDQLKDSFDIVLDAVQSDRRAVQYASERMRAHPEVAKYAKIPTTPHPARPCPDRLLRMLP